MTTLAANLPGDAQDYVGLADYGIDANGNYVFFGFNLSNTKRIVLKGNHLMLGVTINYLQRIATEAQRRRVAVDPIAQHTEVRETPSNPVTRATLEPDIAGKTAALLCTRSDGTQVEAQLPFDLAQHLLALLPETIAEMKRRQAEHRQTH